MNGESPHDGMLAAGILLWGSFGAIVYTYFLYPLVVALLVKIRGPRKVVVDDDARPSVSIVISLYNEEGVLPEKLANLAALEYPAERIEFLLGSDGSDDRTGALLDAWPHPGKRVMNFDRRRGKGPVINDLVSSAKGEIIVFSDANTLYEPGTVRRLIRLFHDPEVGGVCGDLVLTPDGKDPGGVGESSYWSYENWLKGRESDYKTLLGATGGVYAIRRSLFVPLPTHKPVTDDFLIPLLIVKQGYRVIYARDAMAFERTSGSMRGEFRRKARIGAQNFSGLPEFASLLLPGAGFVAFALWSHKIIRWCVPFLGIVGVAATIALAQGSAWYGALLWIELGFLAVAAIGFAAEQMNMSLGLLALPYYVTAMNVALLTGFFRFLLKRQRTTWEVDR